MNTEENGKEQVGARPAHQIRLPSFISDNDIGLGDVIKQATAAVGIKPCEACERRAARLNRWLRFSGKPKEQGHVVPQALTADCPLCTAREALSANAIQQTEMYVYSRWPRVSGYQKEQGHVVPQALTADYPTDLTDDTQQTGTYVYVLGKIEMSIPTLGLEKEIAQALGRSDTAGLTDRQALHAILSEQVNRYLVRQLCWTVSVEGLAAYILQPRDALDYDMLVETIRPMPDPGDMDVLVGFLGPVTASRRCNGLTLPVLLFSQIYSFRREDLIRSIPRPETVSEEKFRPAAEEVLDRVLRMTDNTGATDEDRALNYLIVRYPAIYAKAAEAFGNTLSLSSITTRPSPLSGARNIIEVIFSYSGRAASPFGEKFFVRVDVTEEFPFLVSKLSPYYDR